MATPKYKYMYFNTEGRGEYIRLILAAAKVPYEDFRIEMEDWPKYKETTPWGHVPVLVVDGVQIAHTNAIGRYLANKHGLAGETEIEQAKSDEYVHMVMDYGNEVAKWYWETDETRKAAALKTLQQDTVSKYFTRFDAILKKNESGFLVGKKLTHADIYLAHMVAMMSLGDFFPSLKNYSAVQAHKEKVFSHDGIKEWIAERPKSKIP